MRTDSHGLRFVSFFGAAILSFCVPASDFRSGGFVVFRVSIFSIISFPGNLPNSITGQFEKVEDWLT